MDVVKHGSGLWLEMPFQDMASGVMCPVSPRLRRDTIPLGWIDILVIPQWWMSIRSQPSGGNWSALQEQNFLLSVSMPVEWSVVIFLWMRKSSRKLCTKKRRMCKLIKLSWQFDGCVICCNKDKGKVSMHVEKSGKDEVLLELLDHVFSACCFLNIERQCGDQWLWEVCTYCWKGGFFVLVLVAHTHTYTYIDTDIHTDRHAQTLIHR